MELKTYQKNVIGDLTRYGTGGNCKFKSGIVDSLQTQIVQSSKNRLDKVYDVNVIGNGERPLWH